MGLKFKSQNSPILFLYQYTFMPNKKVELCLLQKKFFLRVTHFFPKNSIESIKTGKITQTPWEKGSSKRHKKADACISTKVSFKKKSSYTKFALISSSF